MTTKRSPSAGHSTLERLEDRNLLSLLGVTLEYPVISFDSGGTTVYDVSAGPPGLLTTTAAPLTFRTAASAPPVVVTPPKGLVVTILVDPATGLPSTAPGDDLIITGTIDLPGGALPDYSGTLLTGEILQFGYLDSGTTDQYDFRFQATGGSLMSYFTDRDIGMRLTSEVSSFTGSFAVDFSGAAKGTVGPIQKLSSIAGYVYHDANDDGVFDGGEAPIPDVTVSLSGTDMLGNPVVQTTQTDGNGHYLFDQLPAGNYTITETQPAEFDDGKDTIGTPGGATANDVFSQIVLPAGYDGVNNNFGELQKIIQLPGSIGDYVWLDLNADGVQQSGEAGVAGVTVNLTGTDVNGPVSLTMATDEFGYYLFSHLMPGIYTVSFVLPAGYAFTLADQGGDDAADSDADRVTGATATITLASGQDDLTWDAGLVRAAVDIEKYIKKTAETGGEGFTPGFWKQCQHFSQWTGYSPWQNYNTVFGVNDSSGLTLLGALQRGGGGAAALGRHAVAALLNAAHANVAYAYTVEQVIAIVQNAYATGNFEAAKNLLATQNELGGNIWSGGKGSIVSGPGIDADTAPGLIVNVGDNLTFTYFVSNPGQVALANVIVHDDNTTPSLPGDDFAPTPTLDGGYNIGDENQDGLLDPGEVWVYTASAVAKSGQWVNVGTVVATPVDELERVIAPNVTDADAANWKAGCLPPPPPAASSLSGYVYVDCDNDGVFDSGEKPLAGVTVKLTGTNDLGQWVTLTATTNTSGAYVFNNLRPGTYAIAETQPAGYVDGKDTLGTLGGTAADDLFSAITVAAGQSGVQYNFGERTSATTRLSRGMTATIGFWNNKNGQALIKSLNGSCYSKALGNWLADNFPNLFGALAGKTNSQVACYFTTLFKQCGTKLEAQVMAVALAAYATNSTLAGGNFAARYGFIVSADGTGAATFNVGPNGAVLGLPNYSYQTIRAILDAADDKAANGTLFKYNNTARSQANTVFTAINEQGDIY